MRQGSVPVRFVVKMIVSFLIGSALAFLVMQPGDESPRRIREAVPNEKVVDVG
jgi:hypothetical protein